MDSGNLAKSGRDYASLIVDVLIAARDLENVPIAGKRWWYHVVRVYDAWIQSADPGDWIRLGGGLQDKGAIIPGGSGSTNIAKVSKLALGTDC